MTPAPIRAIAVACTVFGLVSCGQEAAEQSEGDAQQKRSANVEEAFVSDTQLPLIPGAELSTNPAIAPILNKLDPAGDEGWDSEVLSETTLATLKKLVKLDPSDLPGELALAPDVKADPLRPSSLATALKEELALHPDASWRPVALAALNRFANEPVKKKHVRRAVRQAAKFVELEG